MTNEGDLTWEWHTKADAPTRRRQEAMVYLLAGNRRTDIQSREWFDCQITTSWSGRRTEKQARLAALRRLRILVVHEIQELEGRKRRP